MANPHHHHRNPQKILCISPYILNVSFYSSFSSSSSSFFYFSDFSFGFFVIFSPDFQAKLLRCHEQKKMTNASLLTAKSTQLLNMFYFKKKTKQNIISCLKKKSNNQYLIENVAHRDKTTSLNNRLLIRIINRENKKEIRIQFSSENWFYSECIHRKEKLSSDSNLFWIWSN